MFGALLTCAEEPLRHPNPCLACESGLEELLSWARFARIKEPFDADFRLWSRIVMSSTDRTGLRRHRRLAGCACELADKYRPGSKHWRWTNSARSRHNFV